MATVCWLLVSWGKVVNPVKRPLRAPVGGLQKSLNKHKLNVEV